MTPAETEVRRDPSLASCSMCSASTEQRMKEVLEQTVLRGRVPTADDQLSYTSRAKAVLELAMAEARVSKAGTVDTQHLLLGLVREERGIAAQVLLDFGVTVDKTRAELANWMTMGRAFINRNPAPDPSTAPSASARRRRSSRRPSRRSRRTVAEVHAAGRLENRALAERDARARAFRRATCCRAG